MEFLNWWKKASPPIVEDQSALVADLRTRNTELWASYNKVNEAKEMAQKELAELKGKLREQNEADIYLVSARLMQEILGGKKKEEVPPLAAMQYNLLQQGGQYNKIYSGGPYQNAFANFLGVQSCR